EAFAVNMPNGILRAALCDRVRDFKNITLHPGRSLRDFETDDSGVTAHLDDGTIIRAHLIVGADGRQSKVREVAGIEARTQEFGQSAITCLIEHSRPHDYISTEFHRPTGPFTLVPLPGKMSSVVWVDDSAAADAMIAVSKRALEQALQDRTRNALGSVKMVGTPSCWPLIGMNAKSLTAPRTALVAEAAHVLHPLGAQGLNLSLRDVAVLAETIADAARLGLDYGSGVVLQNYARRRAADIGGRVYGTEGFNHLVSNSKPAIHGLRRAGLRVISAVAPLKNIAMQQGLAPQDADSRLLRGQAL
ncbi:MAG: FAD-dependent monooxygenase, partial [Alphaproteobacteria bacterium]|nr:FAD-dependent monooxygenase [Alphaproteobacteria bacterium]